MTGPASSWEQRGGWVVRALMGEFGLTAEQAAGLVGNLGFESRGFTAFHEDGQPDGIGGYGWAQWTASRRESFFAWCSANGLTPRSDRANYGYLIAELHGAYASTITQLRKCNTLDAAVWSVGQTYERPGGTTATNLPGYGDRLQWARRALAGAQAGPGGAEPPTPDEPAADDIDADLLADLIRAVQRVVGADPDGIFGPKTAAAITEAQREVRQ